MSVSVERFCHLSSKFPRNLDLILEILPLYGWMGDILLLVTVRPCLFDLDVIIFIFTDALFLLTQHALFLHELPSYSISLSTMH